MKIDRRSFLSFVIGGAAGTALTPLPYKLTDDLSIWTQNWPWTPVPADGEVSYVNSTCTLCAGACGIRVRKIDNRAVKIEGLPGHPVNDGAICLLGLSGLQLLYGPNRIQTPLKRSGNRGSGNWKPISWPEAISLVTDRLGKLRSADQAHTVGCLLGSDRGTVPHLFARFMTAFGSPNFFRTPSLQDTYELLLYLMHGTQASAGFDFENADFILSFGSGLIEGWGSPVHLIAVHSKWRSNKAKVVQIEPRLSNTAAKADRWIPINPGTEAALALGLAHVIIKESLYDNNFVDRHAFGFQDWTDDKGKSHIGFKRLVLENYTPDQVSKMTGIEKTDIGALARDFARASRPLAIGGRGQGDTPGSLSELMAVHALNALVGNLNRPGGFWAIPEPDVIGWPELEMDRIAASGMQKDRLDDAGSDKYPFSRYLLNPLVEAINTGSKYPLQVLLVSDANPLYTLPDTQKVRQALDKIPFIVSFSSYMDETTAISDLILPNHTYLERYEDVPAPPGFARPIMGLTRPVVPPQFNTRHAGDTIIQIAKTLGGSVKSAFPWQNYEACLKATFSQNWDRLQESGFWLDTKFGPAAWDRAFETTSARFEFVATALKNGRDEDDRALPYFKPVKLQGDNISYPLILIPYDTMRLANDALGNPPFVTKTLEDTVLKGKDSWVEINPVTAKAHGLSEGRKAKLKTPIGLVKVRVHLYDGIMPGIVALPRGLGHRGPDPYLSEKGANFNDIIAPVQDPVSGLDTAWGIRAALSKA